MIEFFKNETKFRFMKYRTFWVLFSTVVNIALIVYWINLGDSKYGVDFRGGSEVIVEFDSPVEIGNIRGRLEKVGFPDAIVQSFESERNQFSVRLRTEPGSEEHAKVLGVFSAFEGAKAKILQDSVVGPVIGEQIRKDGWLAFWISLVVISLYVWARFDLSFAIGAIVALFHDAIITSGVYLMSGREVNAALLAAILTIVGYSINDTIVVFDRIRENHNKAMKGKDAKKFSGKAIEGWLEVIDAAINQTLSRTILTALTVFVTALTLYMLGGGALQDLAFAMVVGVITGTYSSIFIAAPIVLLAHQTLKRD